MFYCEDLIGFIKFLTELDSFSNLEELDMSSNAIDKFVVLEGTNIYLVFTIYLFSFYYILSFFKFLIMVIHTLYKIILIFFNPLILDFSYLSHN